MSHKENLIDLTERYLMGEMSPEEINAYEKRLSTDTQLMDEYTVQRKSINHLIKHETLKKELFQIYDETKQENNLRIRKFPYLLYGTAAAILLIAVIWVFLLLSKNDSQSLFADYYRPYSIDQTFRNADHATRDSLLTVAISLYNSQQYKKAIPLLIDYSVQNNDSETSLLLLTNCYINTGELTKAEDALSLVSNSLNGEIRQNCRWYQALIALKQDRVHQAKQLFEQIYLKGGVFEKEASELIELL